MPHESPVGGCFIEGMEASCPVSFCGTGKDNWRQIALQISGLLPLNYTFQCDRRREIITIWILFELAAQLQVQNTEGISGWISGQGTQV